MSTRSARQKRTLNLGILILLLISSLFPPTGDSRADPLDAPPPPTPIAPADGVTVTAVAEPGHPEYLVQPPLAIPEVSWTAVEGSTQYKVRFCPNVACSTVTHEATTANTRYTPRVPAASIFPDGW